MAEAGARSGAGGSSFYWAMRLMPREKREAMFALYRYCRGLDDIADGNDSIECKLAALDAWRQAVDRLFDGGDPALPEVAALAPLIWRFDLDREPLEAVIRGMEMDARGEMRAPPLDTLRAYCYCVAGAVGLSAVRIFGAPGTSAREFALALGEALQLTNILRDVREDVGHARLYLPREFLLDAGIASIEPAGVLGHPALGQVCERVGGLAEERFRAAREALPVDPRPLRPAMIMMGVYSRLLERLRRQRWLPAAEPVRVPDGERLWIALRHLGPPATWPDPT
jgi:squalene synthase HpnD